MIEDPVQKKNKSIQFMKKAERKKKIYDTISHVSMHVIITDEIESA